MQAWPGPNPLEMLVLMLLGGSMGMPTGVPPGQLDPLAAKIAPEECLFYLSWAETAEPNSNSTNKTEQLLAEPEIQAFVDRMRDKMAAAVAQSGFPADPELLAALQQKGGAVFLTDLQLRGNQPPHVEGGLLLQLGDDAVAVRRLLENLQDRPELEVTPFEVGQRSFYRIRTGELPTIEWGLAGKYLLGGFGEGSVKELLARARGEAPSWLRELRGKLAVPRPSTISYVNAAQIADLVAEQFPPAERIISVLGLDQVRSLTAVNGLSKTDFISRILLTVDGQPSGLLAWLDTQPLQADDLKQIPRGTPMAISFQLDLGKAVDLCMDLAAQIEPNAAQQMEQGFAAAEQQTGVNFREDLLAALGPTWRIFGQPGPNGMVTGLTIAVDVRDRDRVARAHDQLLRMARAALSQPGAPQLRSDETGERTVHSLTFPQPMPISPVWCLTDNELVIATTPKALQEALEPQATSIATHPTVKPLLGSSFGSLALIYVNTKTVFDTTLPMAKMGLQIAAAQGQTPPGMLDTSGLPPAEVFSRHLQPTIGALRRRPEGIEFASRQTLPGGNVGAAAPVALLLPAVQASRSAARRMQGSNNLNQIAIAMHNYHDANRAFPPRYTVDDNGRPLLSWRVHLLPFFGEQALYDKFRLDEPWDSPNNRQLIAQIPTVYQAAGAEVEPGKTNYLGNAGPDGILVAPKPDKTGTQMSEIRDGTSNTILVFEASNEAAVIWTNPDDFSPDPDNPLQGLLGLRPQGLQVVLADGSVRFLPDSLPADMLRAMLTRSGAEPVEIP